VIPIETDLPPDFTPPPKMVGVLDTPTQVLEPRPILADQPVNTDMSTPPTDPVALTQEGGLPVTTLALPAEADPGGTPDYFGSIPNYANSSLPDTILTENNIGPRPGTLVKSSGPGVYVTDFIGGVYEKRLINTPTTFENFSFHWEDIVTISDSELGSLTDGAMVTSSDTSRPNGQLLNATGGVYFLEEGQKRGITSPLAFDSNGFRWDRIIMVSPVTINSYPDANKVTVVTDTGLRKFIDSLPGLGPDSANNLGQYIPVAVADIITYTDADYYEIALVQYTEQMHSDLPSTTLRGYVQIETPVNASVSNHVALLYPDGSPILNILGQQVYAVDNPHYLGPIIISQRDVPTRIKFTNYLPIGSGGDLFIPVDTTTMGAGMGSLNVVEHIMVMDAGTGYTTATVTISGGGGTGAQAEAHILAGSIDHIQVTNAGTGYSSVPTVTIDGDGTDAMAEAMIMADNYTENRATLHLHGNNTVWISDGTPHQWITPADEVTSYPEGVSVYNVPDMPDPGDGSMTFYYTNAQSARMMFYHDHSYGITRLNVYAGEAAGYLVTDLVEQDLINGTNLTGVNPQGLRVLPGLGIPLIIQDKTFVDATTIWNQDPTWNWGTGERDPGTGLITEAVTGDIWYPHVYMPNQNPADPGGMNSMGRWHYAPWFWPPATDLTYPPVPNPLYDCGIGGACTRPWENEYNPATPNPSSAAEAFMDTPLVNGTVYPYLEVDPTAYRFRILNASDDRFFNLQLYVADPSIVTLDGRINTEVKMVTAAATAGFPETWPTDNREGGVPDPLTAGPSFIQIGTEGGFLPAPVVLENTPIDWNMDPTNFDMGIVNQGTLILGTAERADVIVDFSQYAGKTLILYNDAPAPFPAIDARYDYYTGAPDLTETGGVSGTLAGYGPNTRTIMQIRVKNITPTAPYSIVALESVFEKTDTKGGVFETSQDDIIIPQEAYNSAYNASFTTSYVKIYETSKTFQTIAGDTVTIGFQPKAIQDEMGEAFDTEFGRMSAMLGLELPATSAGAANFVLFPFASPPDPNELGWKETIRVNPLQDTIIAFRPIIPTNLPFDVPNSIRLIDPTMAEGEPLKEPLGGFKDPTGQPAPVINHYVNYGWEYVYHCHLLAHEEMDMMHSVVVAVAPDAPSGLVATLDTGDVVLTWTDNASNETGYTIQRAEDIGFTLNPVAFSVGQVLTYTDTSVAPTTEYFYRVLAVNVVGDTTVYSLPAIGYPTMTAESPPSNVEEILTA
jgi:FtsP/CotA-like multicopper oxidase with cupredoxin domain